MTHKRHRLLNFLATTGIATTMALVLTSAPAQAAYTGTHLHARMSSTSAYPHCYGGARYESHSGWREFEINLHGIRSLSGKTVIVRVHGAFVGRMRVHADGYAHLYRNSGVPTMAADNIVRVRTKSGTLVSSGRLHRMM